VHAGNFADHWQYAGNVFRNGGADIHEAVF
jgi:hypothetical protein